MKSGRPFCDADTYQRRTPAINPGGAGIGEGSRVVGGKEVDARLSGWSKNAKEKYRRSAPIQPMSSAILRDCTISVVKKIKNDARLTPSLMLDTVLSQAASR